MARPLTGVFTLVLVGLASTPLVGSVQEFDSLYLPKPYWEVAPFLLTERSGAKLTNDTLRGKVWVACFFFTCCAGDCPKLTKGMARLQRNLADLPDVVLVSISVHPEADTPDVLSAYAQQWKADSKRWLFLTGEEKAIHKLVQASFKQGVFRSKDETPGYEVDHTFNFMLVDRDCNIRGYTDGRDEKGLSRLEQRVRELVAEPQEKEKEPKNGQEMETELKMTVIPVPQATVVNGGQAGPPELFFPTLNASLNGSCAVLLMLGYVAIRRRAIVLHKACMLTAMGVSVVFLGSYLYYHFGVRHGEPTLFTGEGWVRPFYFVVLTSHTLLAAVVTPLALLTTYLGLRGQLVRHMGIARWTLPLWLYVSVTGVVVYFLLYHLYPPG